MTKCAELTWLICFARCSLAWSTKMDHVLVNLLVRRRGRYTWRCSLATRLAPG